MIGGDIIPEHPSDVIRMARRISLTHHERWDGSGYPAGLSGEGIPIEGRIAAICDVYDALVSNRPYKQPWPREKAVAYLQDNSGIHFDPRLVEAFLSILPEIDAIQAMHADPEMHAAVV
jgi:putative two-component system response regulator